MGAGAAFAAVARPFGAAAQAIDAVQSAAAPAAAPAVGGLVRLNRNENAYGPSPKSIAAIADAGRTSANRYPDVDVEALRRKIATLHAVTPEQVVLGCGSSEILRTAVDTFAGRDRRVVTALPTYSLIADLARRAGAELTPIRLRKDYAYDVDAMLAASVGAGLVYICNPNNPTGSLTPRRELEAFLGRLSGATHVVIDEAYHHYVAPSSDYASFVDRPVGDPRVVVTRSFSKIYALAGLRIGYAIAAPQTARLLGSSLPADNVSAVAAAAAAAAIDDPEHVRANAARNDNGMQEFLNQANARMLRAIDSHTNFAMMNTDHPAVEVVESLKTHDVLVVACPAPFETYLRVSIGAPAEMRQFWAAWDRLPGGHKMSM